MFESKREARDYFYVPHDDPLAGVDGAMHVWASVQLGYQEARGYPTFSPSCRDAVSSRQYEREEEVIEERRRSFVVDAVEGAMDSLENPLHRAVLWAVYANRVGPAVWRNRTLADLGRGGVWTLHRAALNRMRELLRRRALQV